MKRAVARGGTLLALFWLATTAAAQLGGAPTPDPAAILAEAKAASGGSAWDALRTQHSKVSIRAGSLTGEAERWSDTLTGRSALAYTMGPVTGAAGFDGKAAWSQDANGTSKADTDESARELAVNAAYRDRLAFWSPERAPARITYKERAEADGAAFHVIRITPEGGRAFELWINTETHLIERLVEREAQELRTEIYMDMRDVQGVKIPFRVRASRTEARRDEVVTVDLLEFNQPVADARFARPPPPKPDYAFPAGRASVEVPFEMHSGHVFIKVAINGKPVRMLFDSTGHNVLLPRVAASVGAAREGGAERGAEVGVVRVATMEIAGLVMQQQAFATFDLETFLRRTDGLDDVGGVIGYELLRRLPVKLDYERLRATFYDPAKFSYGGSGARVHLVFRGQSPQVRASVDGIAGLFELDTGSRGSLTLTRSFAQAHGLDEKYGAKAEAVYGASVSGPVRGALIRVKSLELANVIVADPVTALARQDPPGLADAEVAGNIGNGILRRFNVTFDYRSDLVYLEKGVLFAEPDVYDRAGVWIERGARGFEVVDVVADGPAAAAGVKPGDVIVAIDGKAFAALPLSAARDALKGPAGRKVRLRIEGGADRIVTLRDIV